MTEYLFTFRSLTQAQTGLHHLRNRGITASLKRTPGILAEKGCGYSITVRETMIRAAAASLYGANIGYNRLYRLRDGVVEEVHI